MEIRERISKFIEVEKLSRNDFAAKIGVQRSNITHILDGRNRPSLDFIEKMLNNYPNVNSEWLILGKGNMYNTIPVNNTLFPDNNAIKPPDIIPEIPKLNTSDKEITKVMILYSDNTFDIFTPNP